MGNETSPEVKEKDVISITQLNMFNTCGESYRRRYIEHEIIPPAIVMIVGSGVDGGVNANMISKRDSKKLLPKSDVVDIAVDTFKKKWEKEGVVLDPDEKALGLKAAKGQAIDRTSILTGLHCDTFANEINPTHVQRKMKVILNGLPKDLVGYIDLQEGTAETGRIIVRDTKTKAKSMSQEDADADDQMTMYAMMVKVVDKVLPEECRLDCLVSTKVPKRVPLVTKRTEEDFKPVIRRIENMIHCLKVGAFPPCPETHRLCSKKYCGYWETCRYVKRPKSVTVISNPDQKEVGTL